MSRAGVRIRPATSDDLEALADFLDRADARPLATGRTPAQLDREQVLLRLSAVLEAGGRTILIAVDEIAMVRDCIVGLLAASVDDLGAVVLTPALHVTHFLVDPGHRRRGVGRALLAAATALAEEQGLDRVVATVASNSREANRYLARLGFAPLVVDRVASIATLRRSLGLTESRERRAVVRRARLLRAQRGDLTARPLSHGA
jgi:ribosomal protein S18 acetylase RimI-like enzyme